MAASTPTILRPLAKWNPFLLKPLLPLTTRSLSTHTSSTQPARNARLPFTPNTNPLPRPRIKTYPPPPSTRRAFPHALDDAQSAHMSELDPKNIRARLFARSNPEQPRPGDVLLAVFRTGDPFAGVCLSMRRRGTDTAILLRNTMMLTGVEMWVKVFSPNLRSLEVVSRAKKRARRARLYYMRKPEHDPGSVDKLVQPYIAARQSVSQQRGKRKPFRGR